MNEFQVTITDIEELLTLYMHSERFSDGSWAHFLQTGRLTAILHRQAIHTKL
jgi:hypothetical protein